MKTIVVGRDFSENPCGVHSEDGPFSAENFRKNVLIPVLKSEDVVTVDLSGVLGYSASFLQEVFGGLVRDGIFFSRQEMDSRLKVIASDKILRVFVCCVERYIDEAWKLVDRYSTI